MEMKTKEDCWTVQRRFEEIWTVIGATQVLGLHLKIIHGQYRGYIGREPTDYTERGRIDIRGQWK